MPEPARAKTSQIERPTLEERIRRRAYELYIDCGNQSGSEVDDWLQAEEEIQVAEEQAVGKADYSVPSPWISRASAPETVTSPVGHVSP